MSNLAATTADDQLRKLIPAQAECFPDGVQQGEIKVLFTGEAETRVALESAARLAGRLNARVSLLVLQTVPRPLEPEHSPVSIEFLRERMRELAASVDAEVEVQIYLCRDKVEVLLRAFGIPSLVVMGGRKSWWPGRKTRLGQALERLGHKVIYIER